MKRVILAVFGTAAALAALLDFKSHAQPGDLTGGALPSAGLPGGSASSAQTAPAPARSATDSPPAGTSAPSPATRSAVGAAVQTPYGVVQVKVSVRGSKIVDVSLVRLTADDRHSQEINRSAAPVLLQETLSAQSARVDAVSGASYTSDGYRRSLQSALDRLGVR